MLETIEKVFAVVGLLSVVGSCTIVALSSWLGTTRKPDPRTTPTPRIGVKLTLHECAHCQRAQMWSTRFGPLTCICGGIYRDAWTEPRVLREAAEIVEKLA